MSWLYLPYWLWPTKPTAVSAPPASALPKEVLDEMKLSFLISDRTNRAECKADWVKIISKMIHDYHKLAPKMSITQRQRYFFNLFEIVVAYRNAIDMNNASHVRFLEVVRKKMIELQSDEANRSQCDLSQLYYSMYQTSLKDAIAESK